MRPARFPIRAGVLATGVATLALGALLIAPAGQAATSGSTSALATSGPMGGDPVYSAGYRCTIGFNVRDSSNVYYFLTSRHCGGSVGTVFSSSAGTVLGTTVGISPANKDYALVKYAAGITPPGTVRVGSGSQDITSAAAVFVGEAVKRSGSTTGVHSGTVTAVNVTVNYAEGSVTGLIKTNVCAEGGDSGGPLFDGTKALGIYSGGSGNCSTGGISYFQPVTEPLAVYGVNVY